MFEDRYHGWVRGMDKTYVVYASNAVDARYEVARKYQRSHPYDTITHILRPGNVSVQFVKSGVF